VLSQTLTYCLQLLFALSGVISDILHKAPNSLDYMFNLSATTEGEQQALQESAERMANAAAPMLVEYMASDIIYDLECLLPCDTCMLCDLACATRLLQTCLTCSLMGA